MATSLEFSKISTGYYEVKSNGELLGELCKERRKGTGRSTRGYVGYVPAYTVWSWWPEDDDADCTQFDVEKVSEAKNALTEFINASA